MLPLSVIVKPLASPSMTACSSATAGFSDRSSEFVPRPMRSRSRRTCVSASAPPEERWMTKLIAWPLRCRSPRNPPVIKRSRYVDDGEDEQQDRERYVNVEPRLQYVLVALLIDEADQQLFSLSRDDEQLPDFFLFVFLDEREKVRPVGGSLCAAPHPSEEQPPAGQPARGILANQLVVNALERRRALGSDARHLFRELIELFRDLGGSQIRFDFRQHARHGDIQNRAENAAGHDDRDQN